MEGGGEREREREREWERGIFCILLNGVFHLKMYICIYVYIYTCIYFFASISAVGRYFYTDMRGGSS